MPASVAHLDARPSGDQEVAGSTLADQTAWMTIFVTHDLYQYCVTVMYCSRRTETI